MSIETKEIRRMLSNMGMMPNLSGFEYCADAISICADDDSMIRQLTKKVYQMVADKFQATDGSVERCIRHAIQRMYELSTREQVSMYTKIPIESIKGKPTNSVFIAAMASYVRDFGTGGIMQ